MDIKLYELIKQKACQKSHVLNTLAYKFLQAYTFHPQECLVKESLPQQEVTDIIVRWSDRKQMRMAMLSNKLRNMYLYLSSNDDIQDELIWSPRDQIVFYLEHIK